MSLNSSEDIRSVTNLKRKTKEILNQVRRTKSQSYSQSTARLMRS